MTVLFVDLVGYTALCSSRDVEQVFMLVRPLMNALRRVVEDLGGVVPGIEGDGFMGVFGAASAREDDPQRALHAAAALQEIVETRRAAYGAGLGGLRVGINAGEVLVAPGSEPGGFAIAGDPVNVASRLCDLAAEGQVLVSSAVSDLVSPAELFDEPHTTTVKNRERPVEHRALRWRELSRVPISRVSGAITPYVERPLDTSLSTAVASAGAVLVVGEAGAGKTRALRHLVEEQPCVLVTAPAFAGPSVGAQLADALRQVPGLPEGALQVLRRAAGELVDADESAEGSRLLAAVRTALTVQPQHVLVDDVHLVSGQDLALLTALAADRPEAVALVCASRIEGAPDLTPSRLVWDLLDDEEARLLVEELLPGVPERVVQVLLARSGGNPLYLEQGAALLLEEGVVERTPSGCLVRHPDKLSELPVAMRLFVSSRLDLLDEPTRELAALAAVVGDPVDVDLLHHLADRWDGVPEQLEVLVERGILRWQDRRTLRFRHQVVRDVAYDRLLRSRRVHLHRVAAAWYAVLPVAGLLASEAAHLEAAVALGEDDCDLVRRTVTVLGQWAMSLLEEGTGQALEVAERGIALDEAHPQCACDAAPLHVARAVVLERAALPAEAVAASRQAVELTRGHDDEDLRALAMETAAIVEVWDASADGARLQEAEDLLRDPAALARLRLRRAWHQVERGLSGVLEAAEAAYHVGVRTGDPRLASTAALDLALLLPVKDPAEAERWRGVAQSAARPGDVVAPAKLAYGAAVLASVRSDPHEILAAARDLRRTGAAALMRHYEEYADLYDHQALTELGRHAEAEVVLERLERAADERPVANLVANVAVRKAHLRSRQGRPAEAEAALATLEPLVGGAPHFEGMLAEARGQVLLERGHFSEALPLLDLASRTSVELGQPALGLGTALLRMIAALSSGTAVTISEQSRLRVHARESGAPLIAALAARWLEQDDLLHRPHNHALDLPDAPDVADVRALDLEIAVLRGEDPDLLLRSAEAWAERGDVIWTARALAWHTGLTGAQHPEAVALAERLGAPEGLLDRFAAQVAGR